MTGSGHRDQPPVANSSPDATPPQPRQDEPFDPNLWSGRVDPSGRRYFQVVQPWAGSQDQTHSGSPGPRIVVAGFACDEGVRRNQGRPGARLGPDSLRRQLAKLPYRVGADFFDAGNTFCDDGDLEGATARFASRLNSLVADPGTFPVILGGGHEVAWATYKGIAPGCRKSGQRLGIINFDAHFDLRDRVNGQGHSGSAFLQIAEDAAALGETFRYLVLGIQPLANHDQLFERARALGVDWVDADALASSETLSTLTRFAASVDTIMLTLCLDVFHQSVAPGVSAPQPLGVFPAAVAPLLRALATNPKLRVLEIAELAPPLDGPRDSHGVSGHDTARLAASLLATLLNARFPV